MQYYVVADDGQKYGPADVPTLAQWAQEGRLNANTLLESMQDASRAPASQVPGIFPDGAGYAPPPGQGNMYSAPPQYSTYQRPGYAHGDDGSSDITKGWIFGAIGFICCPIIFSTLAIYYGSQAVNKGHPQGVTVRTFGIVSLVAGIAIGVLVNMSGFFFRGMR